MSPPNAGDLDRCFCAGFEGYVAVSMASSRTHPDLDAGMLHRRWQMDANGMPGSGGQARAAAPAVGAYAEGTRRFLAPVGDTQGLGPVATHPKTWTPHAFPGGSHLHEVSSAPCLVEEICPGPTHRAAALRPTRQRLASRSFAHQTISSTSVRLRAAGLGWQSHGRATWAKLRSAPTLQGQRQAQDCGGTPTHSPCYDCHTSAVPP